MNGFSVKNHLNWQTTSGQLSVNVLTCPSRLLSVLQYSQCFCAVSYVILKKCSVLLWCPWKRDLCLYKYLTKFFLKKKSDYSAVDIQTLQINVINIKLFWWVSNLIIKTGSLFQNWSFSKSCKVRVGLGAFT